LYSQIHKSYRIIFHFKIDKVIQDSNVIPNNVANSLLFGLFLAFFHTYKIGRVHELLINSEKVSTPPVFEENVWRFLCLWFSITHTHDPYLINPLSHKAKIPLPQNSELCEDFREG
jgi:hypothetical protein